MRLMGIDPGLRLTGYACLDVADGPRVRAGQAREQGLSLVEAGVLRLRVGRAVSDRLLELDADLSEVLERLRPQCAAVEKLYAHYKHPTTAAVMGHARGVVLLGIRRAGVTLIELGATEVKKSLTGNGHASKAQVQGAVQAQLGLAARPEPADVADAIAIAMCAGRRA
jgi:crossover junction endodeoxyribonuclease RuvC